MFNTVLRRSLWILAIGSLLSARLSAETADEKAVRRTVERELAAWDRYDAHGVVSFYTRNTVWQNPFGVRLYGSENLEKFLTRLFSRATFRDTKIVVPVKITDVRMLSPTVATVWSEETIDLRVDPATGKSIRNRHSHYMEVLVKVGADWKVSQSMIMDEIQ